MTEEEFLTEIKSLANYADQQRRNLCKEFALSNNNISVGDRIKDSRIEIIVERIQYTAPSFQDVQNRRPSCVYTGIVLTKKGEPRKDKQKGRINQDNVILVTP
jgi:hypothetical protein